MNLKRSISAIATPLVAAALFTTSAYANEAPQVVINDLNKGQLVFNGQPVQVNGITGDSDGIGAIYGTIQNRRTQMFFTPKGWVKEPTRLPFKFATNVARTTWTTPAYKVPDGDYVYRMRVEDSKKLRTDMIEVAMIVRNSAAIGTNAAAAQKPIKKPATVVQQQQPVAKPAAQQAAKPAGAMAANGMPYCSNPGMDADKDGYGWENEKSCVVAGSGADKNPNCASAASDPDGDGWGWENERSCIVVATCQSTGSDPDGDGWGWENDKSCIVVKTSGKHPPCASPNSDPDGDGYGWESNATCLVAK